MLTIVKTIPTETVKNKLHSVDSKMLGELIHIAQEKLNSGDYKDVTNFLRNEFKVDISEDDVVRYFTPIITEIENELLYKICGY